MQIKQSVDVKGTWYVVTIDRSNDCARQHRVVAWAITSPSVNANEDSITAFVFENDECPRPKLIPIEELRDFLTLVEQKELHQSDWNEIVQATIASEKESDDQQEQADRAKKLAREGLPMYLRSYLLEIIPQDRLPESTDPKNLVSLFGLNLICLAAESSFTGNIPTVRWMLTPLGREVVRLLRREAERAKPV